MPSSPSTTPDPRDVVAVRHDAIARARTIARLLDDAIRIPGTGIGVGLDALIGLVPGLGDVAGGVMSAYVLVVAARAGVPRAVLGRMLVNLATDALVGTVPVLGDLFDVAYKANVKNVRLMEQALDAPQEARRSSGLVVAGVVLGALLIAAVGATVAVVVLRALWGAVHPG